MPPPEPKKDDIAEVIHQAVTEALAGLQLVAAQQGVTLDANQVEETFGRQLDQLLDQFG